MFGESGTSATGRTYYYYKCANVKRRKGCNKKTVQKDWLEDLVVRETMKVIQHDAVRYGAKSLACRWLPVPVQHDQDGCPLPAFLSDASIMIVFHWHYP